MTDELCSYLTVLLLPTIQLYSGDKKTIMMHTTASKIIPRSSIDDLILDLTLDGLLDYVKNFTDPKVTAFSSTG